MPQTKARLHTRPASRTCAPAERQVLRTMRPHLLQLASSASVASAQAFLAAAVAAFTPVFLFFLLLVSTQTTTSSDDAADVRQEALGDTRRCMNLPNLLVAVLHLLGHPLPQYTGSGVARQRGRGARLLLLRLRSSTG